MKMNLKTALLTGTAVVAIGAITLTPGTAQAQTIAIETLDVVGSDDNIIDDLTGVDVQAAVAIDHDEDAVYTIGISIDDDNNGTNPDNDLINITTGGANAGLIIGAGFDVGISDGDGDVIATVGDIALGGGITINGSITAEDEGEDAINLASMASNAAVITLNGGAGSDGTITGVVTYGAGGGTLVIGGTAGGATINGTVNGGSSGIALDINTDFTYVSTGTADTLDDINTIDITDGATFAIGGDESLVASNVASTTVDNSAGTGAAIMDLTGGGGDVVNLGDDNTLILQATGTGASLTLDVDDASTINNDIQLNAGAVIDSTSDQALTFSATAGAAHDLILNGGDLRADVTFDATQGGDLLVEANSTLNNGGTGSITITDATNVSVADGVMLTVGAGNAFVSSDNDSGAITFDGTDGGGDDIINFQGNTGTVTVVDLDGDNNGTAGTVTFGSNVLIGVDANAQFDANVDVDGAVSGTLVLVSGDGTSGRQLQFTSGSSTNGNIIMTNGDDTVNFTGATIGDSSADSVALGDGDDTLTIDGGTINATLDGGNSSSGDALVLANSALTINGTIQNFEDFDLDGQTLTLNNATITGLDTGAGEGIDVNGGGLDINGTTTIDGGIYDQANGAGGTVDFGADGNGGSWTAGDVIDDVNLVVTSGTLSTGGENFGDNGGLNGVSIASDATFNANDDVTVVTGQAFANAGTVNVGSDDTVTADSYSGTGTYNVTLAVDGTGAVTSNGVLATSGGNAVDFTGATIGISFEGGTVDVSGGDVTVEDIMTGTGAVVDTGTIADTFLLNFTLDTSDADDNVDVIISEANEVSDATNNTANEGTANAIETIITGVSGGSITDTDITTFTSRIQNAGTAQEVSDLVDSVSSTVDGSFLTAGFEVSNQTGEIITTRLASLRTGTGDGVSGVVTGNSAQGLQFWGQAFGATGDQDTRDGVGGYDYDTFGFAVGMDTRNLAEDLTLGLAFSYANTESDSDNVNQTETEIDSYFFSLYGDYDFGSGYFVEGVASYGFGEVDQTRQNVGGGSVTAFADFDTNQFQVSTAIGRHIPLENDLTITPRGLINYTHADVDDFTETGAGGLSNVTELDSVSMLEVGLSLDLAYDIQTNNGLFQPQVNVGYRYELLDEEVEATTNFVGGGPTFDTEGFDPANSRFEIGTGFTYFAQNNWELTADYQYEVRSDFDAHSGLLKAAYNF